MNRALLLILASALIFKAQTVSLDSLKNSNLPDSLQIKQISETVTDTLKKKTFDIDDIVKSTATDSIKFDLKNKKMYIFGTGELKYKQTNLKGGIINVDFETNQLEAEGVIDTSDSASVSGFKQTPVLSEGAENYEGTKLKYNFKTQKGFISAAKNVKSDKRYEGSAVKKVDKNTFFVKDGVYTTCKSDTPHTHFTAEEMKVIQKDKIFAKWIFMHIGGVPVPIPIPFAVFPNETGRQSGIIAPTYGSINNRGQYFKNFGYFFAISDYMDLTLNADYYLRGGWGTRARYRYAKRYNYSGNFSAEYSKIIIGEDSDPDQKVSTDWKLGISHNQTITPTLRLDANLSFQTGTFLSNNSTALNELITQDITSNATLNKRWEESGNSLSLSYNRTQNLESGNIREVLPNITFNKSQFYPFRTSSSSRDEAWYEKIGMGYSGNLKFKRDKIDNELKERGGVQHSISINASPKIGYFNISPRVNYVEKWYNKKTQKVIEQIVDMNNAPSIINSIYQYNATDTVVNKDVHEINMLRTFTMGVSASTKLYGMLQPKLLGIEAFRHTLTPSVSYSYNPNFSEEKWGYYETFVHPDGTIERYDPYSKEIFGSVSSSESQNIGFNLGNVFEIKTTKDPTDTTSESKKITLLNLDASTGYNFTADSLKLSSLRLNYRTKIGEFLNFNGSSTYSFYDTDGQKQINEYMVNKGKGLFRLTDLSFSVSTSISGEKLKGEERTGKNEDEEEFSAFKDKNYSNSRIEEDTDFSIPWNLNLSYNYFFRKPGAAEGEATNSNLGINMGFNLAKNWKFGVRGNYDFIREQFSAPQITIYRDLECWEMNFSWYPIGQYTGFRFEIRMKAPELRDVKVTRRSGRFEGR